MYSPLCIVGVQIGGVYLGRELAETERRLAEGKEQVMGWEQAKKALRGKFE
jgi:hypothetical protein